MNLIRKISGKKKEKDSPKKNKSNEPTVKEESSPKSSPKAEPAVSSPKPEDSPSERTPAATPPSGTPVKATGTPNKTASTPSKPAEIDIAKEINDKEKEKGELNTDPSEHVNLKVQENGSLTFEVGIHLPPKDHQHEYNVVCLTSADGWQEQLPCSLKGVEQNGHVVYGIELTKDHAIVGTQFKFVVDGEWKYCETLPTTNDGSGNINNVIS